MSLFADDVFNLADIALDVARTDPDRLAVVEPDGRDAAGRRRYRRHTYAELSHEAESLALGLREQGIAEGTRTVFMAPPSYGACALGLALTRVGATTVWIDPSVGWRNVAERLRRIEPEAFAGIPLAHLGRVAFGWGPRLLRRAIVIGGIFPGAHSLASLRRPPPAQPQAPAVGPDDPAAVLYTTGSTGPAKPALYRHRNLCAVYRLVHQSWRFTPAREVAVDMPVFPAFPFVALSAGGTVVVPPIDFVRQSPADADPQALLEVIQDCGVRSMFGSPVLLENLARRANARGQKAPSLTCVIGGGAPIFAGPTRALLDMMGAGGLVHADYGATEALPTTEMDGREALRETFDRTAGGAGICVGRPFAGVDLKILRVVDGPITSLDRAEELPPGAVGEIIVRGAHVSPEYFGDPVATARNKIADASGGRWHRLGDAGYLDDAGRLWYCGRVAQRVNAAAGALYSLQCEPIFDAHPRVRRSGLVGVPARAGERPVICVELARGPGGDDLPALRSELLALASAHPVTRDIRDVLFHPALPVDPRHNSKIERPALARWAAGRAGVAALALALVACVSKPAADGPQGPDGDVVPGADAAGPTADDAGEPTVQLGEPLVVAPDQLESWVWIPIEGSQCADGTPAGVGVNFTTRSRDLVIWFQGNGVCYDLTSCTMFQNLLTGMGPDPINQLFWGDTNQPYAGLFDRNAPDNPFRDSNFVVLPHCGLDGHTADKESSYPPLPAYQQRGFHNATLATARIVPTFTDATRVVVAGFSAGGIGAMANYHQIATAFASVGQPPPYLIDDAGPLLRDPHLSQVAMTDLRAGWGLDDTLGALCPECVDGGAGLVHRRLAELHPGMKSALVCAYSDVTVTSLYRLLNYDINLLDVDKLRRGLDDLADWIASYQDDVAPSEQHVFYFAGDRHAALVLPLADTPGLSEFLSAQLADSDDWADVR